MPESLFNAEQLAVALHIKAADVQRMVRDHEIPYEMRGGVPVFRKKHVDAWASRHVMELEDGALSRFHDRTACPEVAFDTHLFLGDLLKPERIDLELPSRTRAAVIRDMVGHAEERGLIYDPADLLRSLDAREELCSTGLAGGFALLHPRHPEPYMFIENFILLGRAINPLPFGAPDGLRTDLFFLLGCQEDRLHLHALARLCLACQDTDILSRLRAAETEEEAWRAVVEAEEAAVPHAPGG